MIAAVIFGWPAVFASIVLVAMGIATGRSRLTIAGAIVACPFLLYLSGAPRLRWVAVLLVVPYIGLCGFVAHLVFRQHAG